MLHSQKFSEVDPGKQGDSEDEPQAIDVGMLDRSTKTWARLIGTIFTAGEALCLFAVAILAIAFSTIVANDGEERMILPLIGVGTAFIASMLFLSFTHARALAGHRDARTRNGLRSRAGVAVCICICFAMIHPLMAIAIPLAAAPAAGIQFLLARYAKSEPMWDFLPSEAVSILSGRDRNGMSLASSRPPDHALAEGLARAGGGTAVVLALAAGAFLIARGVMSVHAFLPIVLGALWSVEAILAYTQDRFSRSTTRPVSFAEVRSGAHEEEDPEQIGLTVRNLSVRDREGHWLLQDISLEVPPGTVTGIIGETGAGKSLLLQSIADPFSLSDMEVSGLVLQSGTDLWRRQASEQSVPVVHLPSTPLVLPASGAENLASFQGQDVLDRAKWFLEKLVFSTELVKSICAKPDAKTLPQMQIRALTLARAFVLGPQLYLMDHPEDGLPQKQIAALVSRIEHETRIGRSVAIATDNRALLGLCDRLVVLQCGRIVDFGDAKEVQNRIDNGWARFVGQRKLETEDNLRVWTQSHFHRDGDEANQRKLGMLAANMLALSCQSANPASPGNLSFTFKHFEGHCILRMQDDDAPITTAQIQLAEQQAADATISDRLSPLASIVQLSLEVQTSSKLDDRIVEAKLETYDPRKAGRKPKPLVADARSG